MKSEGLYEKYKDNRHWDNHPTIYAERFLHFLRSKKFSGLLVDVGCGSGRDVNYFYCNGLSDVLGVDSSEKEIESAQKQSQGRFVVDNIEDCSLTNQTVGAVFMINVIHYVDQQKAISEIRRILVNDGYLFIHFNLLIMDDSGCVDYRQGRDTINRLIAGFRIIHEQVFKRVDERPLRHTHLIRELILQKT